MPPYNTSEDVALIGAVGGAIAGGALGTIVGPLGTLAGALLGGVIGEEFERRMTIETEQVGKIDIGQAIGDSEEIEYITVNIKKDIKGEDVIDDLGYDLSAGETITLPARHARSLIDNDFAEDIRSLYSEIQPSVEERDHIELEEKFQSRSIPQLPLKEIRLEGFRSFGQMTRIPLEEGLTVITGPNGSGKSNLIRGISFALGYAHTQGFSETDLNEIFHQPNSETTVNEANVTVVLDNSSGEINRSQLNSLVNTEDVEDINEISIRTRLKQGDEHLYSYFYINDYSVNLVDVQKLLEHANVGGHEYNILTQGDITGFIEMNAQERREIIEEISGTDEYDSKIKHSREQLETIEEALNEVDIRIDERRRVMGSQDSTGSDLEDLKKHRKELAAERDNIISRIDNLKKYKKESFLQSYEQINKKFSELIGEVSNNTGEIHLAGKETPLAGGLTIRIGENEEKMHEFNTMSGGEKALGALVFLLAVQHYRPSPFVVLDEVDAFLDAGHVELVSELVDNLSDDIQVIAVSHRQSIIDRANQIIDVSLEKDDITKVSVSESRGRENINQRANSD